MQKAGIDGVLSMASFSALDFASVPLDYLHGDTTSMALYGQYKEGCHLEITRGYSKDHRPDLKQVIFGMVTAHGIPFVASPEKGNLDDCKIFRNHVVVHEPSPEALEEARRVASMFVLITNVRDEQSMSNVEVLRAYKEQHEVEYRFRFLKSPYFVGPIFLQNNDRVEAFGGLC